MKHKFIYLTIIGGAVIILVIWFGKFERGTDNPKYPATTQAVSSEGISIQSEENEIEERIKNAAKITVKDEKKDRTLYWEDMDLNNMGICADYLRPYPFAPLYSQVLEGHYYYLRHKKGKQDDYASYIIYQDEGKIIGKFYVEDMDNFFKYKDGYYVFYQVYDMMLGRINTENEIDEISRDLGNACEIPLYVNSPLWVYDNYIFGYPRYYIDKETGEEHKYNWEEDMTELVKAPLNNLADVTEVEVPDRIIQNELYLVFVDGKIIYGEENGGTINLYSYDMKTNTEIKFFSFRQRKRRIKDDRIKIQIDKDYIYCGEYLIPISGGEIQIIDDKNKKIDYSYNEKYIYYIDKKFHVHRVDKRNTEHDDIISKVKAMKVDATEQSVYVQGYNKTLFEDKVIPYEDLESWDWGYYDWYSCALYKMDLNGGNLRKIEDEVTKYNRE